MVNQQLLSFVKEQAQKGISRDEISKELLGAGWTLQDIQEVFRGANILDPNPAPEEIPIPSPNFGVNINPNMTAREPSGIPRVDLSRSQDFSTRPNNFIPADNNNSSDIRFVEKKHSSGGIFWIILILIILLGGGFYLYKNDVLTKFLPQNNVEEIPAPVLAPEPEPAPAVIPTQNKLFEFFDTFTIDLDMGTARIEFMYPEEKLILLNYPTSQESSEFAVYDYGNDILYKDIGYDGIGSSSLPEAFLGMDKLLMYHYNDAGTKSLSVIDFDNTLIKTINKNVPVYQVYPKYGPIINIDINTPGKDILKLDSNTLELIP